MTGVDLFIWALLGGYVLARRRLHRWHKMKRSHDVRRR